jgi:hypothetical protein
MCHGYNPFKDGDVYGIEIRRKALLHCIMDCGRNFNFRNLSLPKG